MTIEAQYKRKQRHATCWHSWLALVKYGAMLKRTGYWRGQ